MFSKLSPQEDSSPQWLGWSPLSSASTAPTSARTTGPCAGSKVFSRKLPAVQEQDTSTARNPRWAHPKGLASAPTPTRALPPTTPDRPTNLPPSYLTHPDLDRNGHTIEPGKFMCECGSILSLRGWANGIRVHWNSNQHTSTCGNDSLPGNTKQRTINKPSCHRCGKEFARSDSLHRHLERSNTPCRLPEGTLSDKRVLSRRVEGKAVVATKQEAVEEQHGPNNPAQGLGLINESNAPLRQPRPQLSLDIPIADDGAPSLQHMPVATKKEGKRKIPASAPIFPTALPPFAISGPEMSLAFPGQTDLSPLEAIDWGKLRSFNLGQPKVPILTALGEGSIPTNPANSIIPPLPPAPLNTDGSAVPDAGPSSGCISTPDYNNGYLAYNDSNAPAFSYDNDAQQYHQYPFLTPLEEYFLNNAYTANNDDELFLRPK